MKRFVNIFLSLCCCFAVFAQDLQQFSVVSFEEKPFDTSANDARYKQIDGNGETFSIIKLVAATPGDDLSAYTLDFGLCEGRKKVVDGEVWWYVQRNAMRATIQREGFKTLKNYELSVTVQPGKVYEMTLQAASKVVQRQFLVFEISPVDSEAIITFKEANSGNEYKPFGGGKVDAGGRLAKSLELGVYTYRIISTNYHMSEGLVTLSEPNGKHVEKVSLRPNFANVTLNAQPGVEIYINEENMGLQSWAGKLSPGTYSIECRKPSHKSSLKTIVVEEGKDVALQLQAPAPITGTLSLSSNPLGAKITIDGKKYGETPDFITDLVIGEHKVELTCAGYKSETVTVAIRENEETECNLELKPLANGQGGDNAGHEYVDLGLSVKWATCNVGATKPEEYGGYYAWGETEEKEEYYESNMNIGKNIAGTEYDVAHVKWGGNWRMPTRAEQDELREKCKWEWTTVNGVSGYKVTSKKNGNSIFLPAAGYRSGVEVYYRCGCGYYWSSLGSSCHSYGLDFDGVSRDWSSNRRNLGFPVRPVCD